MNKKTKIKLAAAAGFVILFALLMWFLFSGGNFELLRSIFLEEHTRDELRDKLADFGVRGYVTIAVLSMLQVVMTFLPAEPVQVLAGVTFGFPIGLACCMAGVVLGNSLVFALYRAFGERVKDYFVKNLHFDLERAAISKKLTAVIFLLYFLPAIPYGMICFFAASLGMKYYRYITVTFLGALPSVCIGVGLGHVAIASSWIVSAAVLAVLLAVLAIVMIKREAIFGKLNGYIEKGPYSSKTIVKKYKPRTLILPDIIARTVLFFKGVKVKYEKRVKEVETPSIVLCNHGSFTDFVYAGTLLRKKAPNFIVARLYFYKKQFGNLLRRFGCFPKSMFTADIESAKNCLRVLRSDGVLAMMPEARLSTVGKFEDIQEGTFAFLKKSAVPVYSIKMTGDYFASPKWGTGMRRGSRVYAELDLLISREEIAAMTQDEIKARVLDRLYYDEFEWIKTQKNVRYKSKRLAEGLENILSRCPKCNSKYTITTKKHDVFCEKCGKLATIDNRYSFVSPAPFENFAEWYEWQREKLRCEIIENPEFSITSEVELRQPPFDGKTFTRAAGRGVATLDRLGLSYTGRLDGDAVELKFPISDIYRLLFGAGEDFEIYVGQKIYYFVPDEKRSAVDWYLASQIFRELYEAEK